MLGVQIGSIFRHLFCNKCNLWIDWTQLLLNLLIYCEMFLVLNVIDFSKFDCFTLFGQNRGCTRVCATVVQLLLLHNCCWNPSSTTLTTRNELKCICNKFSTPLIDSNRLQANIVPLSPKHKQTKLKGKFSSALNRTSPRQITGLIGFGSRQTCRRLQLGTNLTDTDDQVSFQLCGWPLPDDPPWIEVLLTIVSPVSCKNEASIIEVFRLTCHLSSCCAKNSRKRNADLHGICAGKSRKGTFYRE